MTLQATTPVEFFETISRRHLMGIMARGATKLPVAGCEAPTGLHLLHMADGIRRPRRVHSGASHKDRPDVFQLVTRAVVQMVSPMS